MGICCNLGGRSARPTIVMIRFLVVVVVLDWGVVAEAGKPNIVNILDG